MSCFRTRLLELLLELLYPAPYVRGKGQLILALLRAHKHEFRAPMPYGGRIWIGADAMRQAMLPYWIGPYESDVLAAFKHALARLAPNENVIDAGANLGFYTILAASFLRQRGNARVFAFEPNEAAFFEIMRNVQLNRFQNVSLARQAVSDQIGTAVLFASRDGVTLGSLRRVDERLEPAGVAQTITLDSKMNELGRIGLVKLDIEGAELLALRGARELLKRDHPSVFYEEFDEAYVEFGYCAGDVRTFLEGLGYRIFRIESVFPRSFALTAAHSGAPVSAARTRNMLALPQERTW